MSSELPEIQAVHYTVNLPKAGKLTYRPVTVKEEGIIFTANEMGEEADLIATLKNIVKDCVKEDIIVDDLLAYEFVYLLMLMRSKSKGSYVKANLDCPKCKEKIHLQINLDDIEVFKNKQTLSAILDVTDDLTVEIVPLKADSIDMLKVFSQDEKGKFVNSIGLMARMIDKVVFKKKVFTNFPEEQLINNILSKLTVEQLDKLGTKLKELITFGLEIKYTCSECEKESKFVFKDPTYFLR